MISDILLYMLEIIGIIIIYVISWILVYWVLVDPDREYAGWQILSLILLAPLHIILFLIFLVLYAEVKLKRIKKKK